MSIDRRKFLQLSAASAASAAAGALGGCGGVEKIATSGVPRSPFDEDSTAEEVTEGIDLTGKLALVTGCTSGLGFETMRVLAKRGAMVAGTSRSLERAEEACNKVLGATTAIQLELSDFDSVVACANIVRAFTSPLDMLICNAGYYGGSGEVERIRGLEKHFVINHLGHYVLVNRLLGRLYMASQGRVVVVSSRAAYTSAPETGIEFDQLDGSGEYDDRRAYGHSKLANALYALQLGKLLKGTRITANALHPGVINTEIDRHMGGFTQKAFAIASALGAGKTVEQGAATSCFVATHPSLGSTSSRFFEDCNAVTVANGHLHDEAMAERLWQVSEQLTRDYLVSHDGADLNEMERPPEEPAET
ncbi:MAG: SDR family NAD(P)-dependent oxidoreductase [Gammaproteobacteria bacterium]|nr:SDR family NAD(P)-dependent oxidoreductase [Gammaproteobacteria bacterium]